LGEIFFFRFRGGGGFIIRLRFREFLRGGFRAFRFANIPVERRVNAVFKPVDKGSGNRPRLFTARLRTKIFSLLLFPL
jgi:hypothetical protein